MTSSEVRYGRYDNIADPLLRGHLQRVDEDGLIAGYTKKTAIRTGPFAKLFGVPKLRNLKMLADDIGDLGMVSTVVPKRKLTGVGNDKTPYYDRTGVDALATLIHLYYRGVKTRSVTYPIPWQAIVDKSRMALGSSEIAKYINDPKPDDLRNLQLRRSLSHKYPGPKLGRPPAKKEAVEPKDPPEEKRVTFFKAELEELGKIDREKIEFLLYSFRNINDKTDSISHREISPALEKAVKEMLRIYEGKPPINYDDKELLNYGQAQWGLKIVQQAFHLYPQFENVMQILAAIMIRAKMRQSSLTPGPKI